MPDSKTIQFRLLTSATYEERIRAFLDDEGAMLEPGSERFIPDEAEKQDYPDPAFAPLVWITGAIVVGYLAKIFFKLWQSYKFGGLIIDMRDKDIRIREHPALERGHVLFIFSDKIEEIRPASENELLEILKPAVGSH